MITEVQQKFIDFIVEGGALKFGEFILKSGRKSPFIVNLEELSSGKQLSQLIGFYGDFIYKTYSKDGFDILFGSSPKDSLLASAITKYLYDQYNIDVKCCLGCKEVRRYEKSGPLLGSEPKDGERVLIVSDVITSGRTADRAVSFMRSQGDIKMIGGVVAIDRHERADGTTESALGVLSQRYGFAVTPIINMRQVIAYLHNSSGDTILTEENYLLLRDYYKEYGV